jgi:hypothetical protein
MEILPFCSHKIFLLLFYMVKNKHLFTNNLEVHNHDTRSANNFRLSSTNLTKYRKVVLYAGIKIFNNLPAHVKYVANAIKIFKSSLKRCLLSNSFYSTEEYFNSNK